MDGQETATTATTPADLTAMMRMLIEDRERREKEIAEDRRRREEENEHRMREMRQQMDMLQRLVTERATSAPVRVSDAEPVKLTRLAESDDIEAYLTTFERMMEAFEVDRARWPFKLAPQLTGKAQQAYAAMSVADAKDNDAVKAAILRRCHR